MDGILNQVFFPASFIELFLNWSHNPEALIYAAGTNQSRCQGQRFLHLGSTLISLDKLEELRRITRTERYLEIGSMVTLNRILALGKIVPEVLTRCLENTADSQVRNLATIGGNIICRRDTTAPLLALDAHYEFRSATTSRWISASRFLGAGQEPVIGKQEILTRIRVPLDRWDYSLASRLVSPVSLESRGVIVFIAKITKDVFNDARIVFSGSTVLHNRQTENILTGKKLPLSSEQIALCTKQWESYLLTIPELDAFLRMNLINFVTSSVQVLHD
jgi:CO/xanthine dehydrogenase FAD-binding subunit